MVVRAKQRRRGARSYEGFDADESSEAPPNRNNELEHREMLQTAEGNC